MTTVMGRFTWAAAVLAAATLISGPAAAVTIDIFAKENSVSGGTPLDTGIDLIAGNRLIVNVDPADIWSAGPTTATQDRTSNADGLGHPLGTDFGDLTLGGASFPFGALVGLIGTGDYFLVGTSFDEIIADSGRLFLVYWDSNNDDNSGVVTASIGVPEPAMLALLGAGLLGLGMVRRRRTV